MVTTCVWMGWDGDSRCGDGDNFTGTRWGCKFILCQSLELNRDCNSCAYRKKTNKSPEPPNYNNHHLTATNTAPEA